MVVNANKTTSSSNAGVLITIRKSDASEMAKYESWLQDANIKAIEHLQSAPAEAVHVDEKAARYRTIEFTASDVSVGTMRDIPRHFPAIWGSDLEQTPILLTGAVTVEDIPMDQEVMDMCERKGLLPYIPSIRDMIHNTYRGVNYIKLERVQDPEAPEYEKLCFEIYVTSEPHQVLDDEDAFYDAFFSEIPQDKRDSFVFIYEVS